MTSHNALDGASVLLTGGTGSFGRAFVARALAQRKLRRLVVYSRDEMKQWDMAHAFADEPRLSFTIGDVRDRDRLRRALDGIDLVVHAAATKIVPTAEYNPFECVKTNVLGAMNVIDACIEAGVHRVVALSTDKASNPINLYGATKLTADKLFIAANPFRGTHTTRFAVVRYGNVMGSRGSVIPFFRARAATGVVPITDPRMTRFMIALPQAIDLVLDAFAAMTGGEIFVPKIPSIGILDIARAVAPEARHEIIGIRPGEKLHEQMIGSEDAAHTFEYDRHFAILPAIFGASADPARIGDGRPVAADFRYTSDTNTQWMSVAELQRWLHTSHD